MATRKQLMTRIAERANTDPKTADAVLRGFTEEVQSSLSQGEPFALSGFVTFRRSERAARVGRNPQTGAPVNIPAKTVVKARLSKAFSDAIMGGGGTKKAAAKKSGGAGKSTASKSSAAKSTAKSTGGATKKSAAAQKSAGTAKKTTGAAKKSAGTAKKATGARKTR
jgi:DNA-binding protein HU-beta